MCDSLALSESWQQIISSQSDYISSAKQVLFASKYVQEWGDRRTSQAEAFFATGLLKQKLTADDYLSQLAEMLQDITTEAELQSKLRQFRQQQMVRIIWRDLAGWADLHQTIADLSNMADACIKQSLVHLYEWQKQLNGMPVDAEGQEQCLLVLGMGKLGAAELNLSSDIDLIFAYPENGDTLGGKKNLSNEEFFTRLGRKLIQSLNNQTVDGFVFRVDMRLRPFGESGPMVSSFDGIEDYYQTQGREWERYAMIKARIITGTKAAKQQLKNMLRPFVFRQYLDYGSFEALREMKSMIAAQLHKKGMEDNIKLGAGGIREIEFIGQVFQLIYGGRDPALQQRPILTILEVLAERNLLTRYAVDDLKAAYVFLRNTEHRIQAWADQQTHLLPKDDDSQARLAKTMHFADWQQFYEQLEMHRTQVRTHFDQLLLSPQADEDDETIEKSLLEADDEHKVEYLRGWGYQDPQDCLEVLNQFLSNYYRRTMTETGQSRLERLLPLLIQAAASMNNADACLKRLIPLLAAIIRRSSYMSLLIENPMALSQLVKLCSASPLISKRLTQYPILLDELLDPRSLYHVENKLEQKALLHHYMDSVDEGDLEQQMSRLREFKQAATLHVAAADITEVLPLMRVGDQLSELAEVILEKVWQIAWQHLVERHGYPPCTQSDDIQSSGFTILAYGKLGGLELGYGSDLDLVFIYDDMQEGETSGDKPIHVMMFYTRLAQRMIHLLNTVTAGGQLYEVDTRLRPSGASGLLVTALSGFDAYQLKDAWTWEHQALVRARCVLGDESLIKKVNEIRCKVLSSQRDASSLLEKVQEMRIKMRSQLDKSTDNLFDLKQGHGGITDIEFMVQYAVLAFSIDLPELLNYTDNIRILDVLKDAGKLEQQEAMLLTEAYRFYRSLANRCVLQEQPAVVSLSEVEQYPAQVSAIRQKWLREI